MSCQPQSLPVLQEVDLNGDDLDCVFADLDDFVAIEEILGRNDRGTPVAVGDIHVARQRFLEGEYSALQITYRFIEKTWTDTIIKTSSGSRLLRMETD